MKSKYKLILLKLLPAEMEKLKEYKRNASAFYSYDFTWEQYVQLISEQVNSKITKVERSLK